MTPTVFGAQRESRLVQMSAMPGPWLCFHWNKAGLGTRWSPLAKEISQCLQPGRGGRERLLEEKKVVTHLSGLSPFEPASQWKSWEQNKQVFCWWIFPSSPSPSSPLCFPALRAGLKSWGWVSNPCLLTRLWWPWACWCDISAGPHCRHFDGYHAGSSFAQPWHCQDGRQEMGLHQWSPEGWGNQSLNGLWEQSVPYCALRSCRWFISGRDIERYLDRKPLPLPKESPASLPRAASPKLCVSRLAACSITAWWRVWGLAERSLVQHPTVVPCKTPRGGGIRVLWQPAEAASWYEGWDEYGMRGDTSDLKMRISYKLCLIKIY